MSGFGIEPLKLGVKFTPPKLVVLYRDGRSGKTHRRSMPLRRLNKNLKDLDMLVADLVEDPNHHRYGNRWSLLPRKIAIPILRYDH